MGSYPAFNENPFLSRTEVTGRYIHSVHTVHQALTTSQVYKALEDTAMSLAEEI